MSYSDLEYISMAIAEPFKMNTKRNRKTVNANETGFSLAELLIVSAVGMALIAGVVSAMNWVAKSTRKVDTSLDLSMIKSGLIEGVSCPLTLLTPCVNGSYVELKNSSGGIVVSAGGSMKGRFTVRARCVGGAGLDVRAAWLSAAGSTQPSAIDFTSTTSTTSGWFRRDEVDSNLIYNWEHPKGKLFSGSNLLCSLGTKSNNIPVGGIIMWSGSIADLSTNPELANWRLCDGTSGTPDLRGRFIVGAQGGLGTGTAPSAGPGFNPVSGGIVGFYTPGSVGGETAHRLTQAELAAHTHRMSKADEGVRSGGAMVMDGFRPGTDFSPETVGNDYYHENRPPYYALAFIMRVL
jgi:hypothetical protein